MKLPLTPLFFLIALAHSLSPATEDLPIPMRIKTCMESPKLKTYKTDPRVNPYYLRGDFDGDGRPDFAVMVIGPKSDVSGLVICQGDGKTYLLGAGSTPKFSAKKDDNFLSSDWEVLTLAEFRELLYDKRVGELAKGEVISLNWEDGDGYVYWDGKQYRWFEEPAGGPHT